jgi:hypothetical protein
MRSFAHSFSKKGITFFGVTAGAAWTLRQVFLTVEKHAEFYVTLSEKEQKELYGNCADQKFPPSVDGLSRVGLFALQAYPHSHETIQPLIPYEKSGNRKK